MITLIAAIAKNRTIGKDGQLVWSNKEDLTRFRDLTKGKTVLMGRKTWESIPQKFRPLPERENIIITRNTSYKVPDNVRCFESIDEALQALSGRDVMIIGGAEIYHATINIAQRLELTEIAQELDGDTFFPSIDQSKWKENVRIQKDGFSFVTYHKT